MEGIGIIAENIIKVEPEFKEEPVDYLNTENEESLETMDIKPQLGLKYDTKQNGDENEEEDDRDTEMELQPPLAVFLLPYEDDDERETVFEMQDPLGSNTDVMENVEIPERRKRVVEMVNCSYCSKNVKTTEEFYLLCLSCNKYVHTECLQLRCVPGGLLGDTFFNFVCLHCNKGNSEEFTRQKLSWFSVTVLALYNLHERSEGNSKRGFFHWKSHICYFIDRHWSILFGSKVKKTKSWMGTVSGTLSHFCPSFFLSGIEELMVVGWWRLVHTNMIPQQIVDIHARKQASKKKTGKCHGAFDEMVSSSPLSSAIDESSMPDFEDTSSVDFSAMESEQDPNTPYFSDCASTSESTANEQSREQDPLGSYTDVMEDVVMPERRKRVVKMVNCSYCSKNVKTTEEFYLLCLSCNKYVHTECLQLRVPGGLLGDTFFNFVCLHCNKGNSEDIRRQNLSWFTVTVLALYNLHKRSEGISKRGFFHWKSHVCYFIDRHWSILFGSNVKKKKSWMGSVKGILSRFCPSVFLSGTEELKEPGWWRLVHTNMIPQQIVDIYARKQASKKITVKRRGAFDEMVSSSPLPMAIDESSLPDFEDTSSMDFSVMESEQELNTPYSYVSASTSTSNEQSREDSEHHQAEMKSVFPDRFVTDEHLPDMDEDSDDVPPLDFRDSCSDSFHDFKNVLPSESSYGTCLSRNSFSSILPDMTNQSEDHLPLFTLEEPPCGNSIMDNIDLFNPSKEKSDEHLKIDRDERNSETVEEIQETEPVLTQSLFAHTPAELRIPPWKESEAKEQIRLDLATQTNCIPVSEYKELQLLSQLRQASKTQELPGHARRLYRKLCVRQLKRKRGLPIFNLDKTLQKGRGSENSANVWMKSDYNSRNCLASDASILDRFYLGPMKLDFKEQRQNCSFKIRLMGSSKPECVVSSYTQRKLKPFIRRDYETTPRWLKLLSEIEAKVNKNNSNWQPPQRYPIDYCYVRPQHISTVNNLCCDFFYPGIDLSEALQYPDFSCVVLYKKLVVAFAFMVPDSGYNETYISFLFTRPEWRGAGIATFMLYHLIQTCMGKDITLHVSVTNPAVLLYQKFGFKIEEFVVDFYDKYLPADSPDCKHALFLRLSR